MSDDVERGSGKVLSDLGLPDAELLEAKIPSASAIYGWRRRHHPHAATLGLILKTWKARVAEIAAYRLEEIPLRYLIRLACGLLDGSVSAFNRPGAANSLPADTESC